MIDLFKTPAEFFGASGFLGKESQMSTPFTETVKIPFEMTNKNDGQGHHWGKTAQIRKMAEQQLRLLGFERTPFECPVRYVCTRVLGPRQKLWDNSSIGRGNWKQIEDALVNLGWFHDDSPKWITKVEFEQDATDRKNGPYIRLKITEDKV